jgi:Tfp pilus assembly protein PilV
MAMNLMLRARSRRLRRLDRRRRRSGLSIIEIMVAMMLFGTVTIAMAGLSLVVARRAEANDLFTKRTALLQQQMNWLQALPYDSLPSKEGKHTVSDGAFPHTRWVSLAESGRRTRVTVTVVAVKDPERVEQIEFDRARPSTTPLCKGC